MITPAQKFIQASKVKYKEYEYKCTVDHNYGEFAAESLGIEPGKVFKTIVLVHEKTFVTAVTPADGMISMKKAARLLSLKGLEMAKPADVTRITGYIIGGVSPLGQKRKTITIINESAMKYDEILVSGGRRGFSIGLSPTDLVKLTDAKVGDFLEHSNQKK